jgi:hypothetical protein
VPLPIDTADQREGCARLKKKLPSNRFEANMDLTHNICNNRPPDLLDLFNLFSFICFRIFASILLEIFA